MSKQKHWELISPSKSKKKVEMGEIAEKRDANHEICFFCNWQTSEGFSCKICEFSKNMFFTKQLQLLLESRLCFRLQLDHGYKNRGIKLNKYKAFKENLRPSCQYSSVLTLFELAKTWSAGD